MHTSTLLCCVFCCMIQTSESDVNYTILSEVHGDLFECGQTVIVQCSFSSVPPFFSWLVTEKSQTSNVTAATCLSGKYICNKNPAYPNNYSFTFDSQTGVSNLTITSVDFDEDGLQFFCNDGSTYTPFTFKVVEISSESETTVVTDKDNKTEDDEIIFRMTTNCVFPVDQSSFNVTWFRMKDGEEKILQNATSALQVCDKFVGCTVNSSSKMTSELEIPALIEGHKWKVGVKIKFDDFDEYIVTADGYFYFSVDKAVCEERLCIPCWGFTIILSVFSVVSLLVICANEYYKDGKVGRPCSILFCVPVLAHVAVTIAARFCKDETSCEDCRCLPCSIYCLLLTFTFLVDLSAIKVIRDYVGHKHVLISGVGTAMATLVFVGIILASAFCDDVEDLCHDDEDDEESHLGWIYGLVLALIFLLSIIISCTAKLCCRPCKPGGKGHLMFWELAFSVGILIFISFGILSVILTGYFENDTNEEGLSISFWQIYLIICGCILFLFVIYYFLRAPVHKKTISVPTASKPDSAKL